MFSQLYFTGLKVDADWSVALQLLSSAGQPCVQLIQRVLELTQTQQRTLQLMLIFYTDESKKIRKVNNFLYLYLLFRVNAGDTVL